MKKYISWNVNGLRAVMNKGFMDFFEAADADAFCLQETKLQEGQIELELPGYHQYWDYAEKKGYSGTAIFTRKEPLNVTIGVPDEIHDHEGRSVCLEFEDHYLLTVYVPNSQNELQRLSYRMEWEDDWRKYVNSLREKKPVVYCGDLNVAHEAIDLKNPKTNHKNAGFTDEERAKMTELLASGFVDTFRYLYPEKVEYSWWSYRMNARAKNVGWRIDYFIVSEEIKDKVRDSVIYGEVLGSDHAPVGLILDI
ncbi:MAG: exodeoxyribonuclease III [Eubacteriales bacterium]|nr:exodeoxyribonuclease III [Eubacteriales bacterium]